MTYTLLINKIYNFLLLRTTMQLSYKCTSNCPKNSKNKSNILIATIHLIHMHDRSFPMLAKFMHARSFPWLAKFMHGLSFPWLARFVLKLKFSSLTHRWHAEGCCRKVTCVHNLISNGWHSSKFTLQVSLEFYRWSSERFIFTDVCSLFQLLFQKQYLSN
jgi:hypothetical protein